MKHVLRFMSAGEAIRLLGGEIVHNKTSHRANGNASDALGFCFWITEGKNRPAEIRKAASYLNGVTDLEICLFGLFKEEYPFMVSEARYRDGMHKELSTTVYGLDAFESWEFYSRPPVTDGSIRLFCQTSAAWVNPQIIANSKNWKVKIHV